MGWDVSYHPVDTALYEERILPYVMGEGDIDDLVARAVRQATNRFRANAWGLGLLRRSYEEGQAGIIDAQLHVWGRPFLIAAESPEEVSQLVDRYLAASPSEAEDLAREMAARLAPDLDPPLQPSREGTLPSDADLAQSARWKLDVFRAAYRALKQGEASVTDPNGNEHDPRRVLARDLPFASMELVAALQPGWMGRGLVWPTQLLREARLVPPSPLETPRALFAPLLAEVPELDDGLAPMIVQNYSLGGYVPPARVPSFRAFFEEHREDLLAPSREDPQGDPDYVATSLRKILEALHDAERREQGFLEASEIYSAPLGVMN